MPLSIKVNLRVTGHCNQGGRKYMEDMFSVAYQQTSDDRDLEYAFFGIFDGHGGGEAAKFAKDHLMDIIVKQKNFWSDKDEDVLRAIRDGYVNTHYAMWRELDKWPRTASGLPSTAGTTASIAFIRKGKIYIGHVGDSGIVLGYQDNEGDPQWKAKPLTKDHKPESGPEMTRIQESGGKVISKSGVARVVWNRPRIGHKGPVRRSTHIDEIPFLAVARSLGDLWSYNSELDTFVVSPEPDVKVIKVDVKSHRCLIFGTDGLWNMLTPQAAVSIVQAAEKHNEKHFIASQQTGNVLQSENQMWINPSKSLVDRALERWSSTRLRADNTSVVTLMIDPPGPSRIEFLLNRSKNNLSTNSLPNYSPICRPPSSNFNHSVPNLEKTSTKDFHSHPQVNTSDTKLLENNYCPNQPFSQPISSPLTVNEKLVSNYSNDKNADLLLNSNIDKIAHPVKKQQNPISVVDTVENNDDTMNYSNSENIQVAEVSSSDITISDANISKSTPSINSHINVPSSAEDNDENSEAINYNNPLEAPLEKVLDNTESFCDQTLWSEDTDDGQELVRQNAFSNPLSDFNLFRSTVRQAINPNTIKSTTSTPINNNTNSITNDIATVTPTVSGSQDINETYYDENIKNNTPVSCMKKFEIQKDTVMISNKSSEGNVAHLNGATLKIKRREISLRSNITTRVNSKTVHKAIVSTSTKRRHSSTFDITPNDVICNIVHQQEPCLKRRTRSEDRKCLARNENNPNNQKQVKQQLHGRLRWINSCSNIKNRNINATKSYTSAGVENNIHEKNILLSTASTITTPTTSSNSASSSSSASFQRRNLEKKATPMKNTRRGPVNYVINNGSTSGSCNGVGCSPRLAQLRKNFTLKDWDQMKSNRKSMTGSYSKEDHRLKLNCMIVGSGKTTSNPVSNTSPPQRWLRSDTIAATPIKTLRSRNVDIAGHTIPPQIAHQYGIVKQNRHSPLNTKLNKLSSATTKIISKTSMQLTTSKLIKPNNGMNHENNASNLALSNSVSVIAKRVKSSSYNSNTRSRLGTRSRLKRLSK